MDSSLPTEKTHPGAPKACQPQCEQNWSHPPLFHTCACSHEYHHLPCRPGQKTVGICAATSPQPPAFVYAECPNANKFCLLCTPLVWAPFSSWLPCLGPALISSQLYLIRISILDSRPGPTQILGCSLCLQILPCSLFFLEALHFSLGETPDSLVGLWPRVIGPPCLFSCIPAFPPHFSFIPALWKLSHFHTSAAHTHIALDLLISLPKVLLLPYMADSPGPTGSRWCVIFFRKYPWAPTSLPQLSW